MISVFIFGILQWSSSLWTQMTERQGTAMYELVTIMLQWPMRSNADGWVDPPFMSVHILRFTADCDGTQKINAEHLSTA